MLTAALLLGLTGPLTAAVPAPVALPASRIVLDDVDDRITAGREHLLAGRLDRARAEFEAARAQEESWRTEFWILRVDAQDAPESVLGILSRKARAGEKGPELDYLTGVAFAAQADAAASGGGSGAGFLYVDAVTKLRAALEAQPERFADAWQILARAARAASDSETSLMAAEKALEYQPGSVALLDLRGRAALALFSSRYTEEPRPEEVQDWFETARDSFVAITRRIGTPSDTAEEAALAAAWNQLGTVHAFDGDMDAARNAYGEAVGWDPTAVDLGQVLNTLGAERFVAALDFATERFAERHAENDARDATIQWWRGWAIHSVGDVARFDDGEQALLTAYEKWSGYTNAWYWLMRLRYDRELAKEPDQRDFTGAIDAFERYGEVDRPGLIATVKHDPVDEDRIVYLIGQAAGRDLEAAAFMSEVLTELAPENDEYWNNLGLFLRDSAQMRAAQLVRARRRGDTVDPSEERAVMRRYERAWQAYNKALELDPSNPRYHNDAAVMLHYYLEREYDRALAMYDRSIELAEEALADGPTETEAADMRKYIGWAQDNKKLLLAKMQAEREGEAPAEPQEPAGGGAR